LIRHAMRDAIICVCSRYPFAIDVWVLLPDHLYSIWALPKCDTDFSARWRLIKTCVTKACDQRCAYPAFLTARRTAKNAAPFGNTDIGSIFYMMTRILNTTWIICISIR
ncbi:MAG TPA: hypothetical protein PK129_18495, partial [Cellvibrionaceae bacterium]|nr:hypothetical protein [Cellvibrionaceae bacterium]